MAELAIVISAKNQAEGALKSVQGDIAAIEKQAKSASERMREVGQAMQGMGAKLSVGVTAPIVGFAAAAVKGAAEAEQLQVAFTTMLGSADKAQALMADISKFAAATPFESKEIQGAGKQLLAFGFSAEEIIPTLTSLGDVAAGLGIPLQDMAYLFGTSRAQGRLFMADINQFSSRGVPIIKALATAMGVSESAVRGLVEEGKVGFPELQKAMNVLTQEGGQFSGLMEAQSTTFSGLLSTLSDNVDIAMTEIGKAIIEGFDLKGGLTKFIAVVERIKNAIVGLAQTNPKLFKIILTVGAFAAALGPLLVGLGTLLTLLAPLTPAFLAFGAALAVVVSPLGLIVAGLAALFALDVGGFRSGLTGLVKVWKNYRDATIDAGFGTTESQESINLFPKAIQPAARAIDNFIYAWQNYRDATIDAGYGTTESQEALNLFPAKLQPIAKAIDNTIYAFKNYYDAVKDAGYGTTETKESIGLFPEILQPVVRAVDEAIGRFEDFKKKVSDVGLAQALKDAVAGLKMPDISEVWKSAKIKITTLVHDIDWQVPVDAFTKLKDKVVGAIVGVNWGSLGENWASVIQSKMMALKTNIVNAIVGSEWAALGENWANAIKGKILALKTNLINAIMSIDWATLGETWRGTLVTKATALKEAIVGAVTSIDWGALAADRLATLSAAIIKLKDAIIGAILGVEWNISPEQTAGLQGTLDKVKPIIDGIFGSNGVLTTINTSINDIISSTGEKIASLDAKALGEQFTGIFTMLAGMATVVATSDIEGTSARVSSIISLANDILGFLTNFGSGIDAETIGAALGEMVKSIGTTLAQKFADPELLNIGESVGAFVGTIITKIGEALASPTFGQDVGQGVGAAVGSFAQAATSIIGSLIGEISKVDWTQFQGSLYTFVNGFLAGVVNGLTTLDWSPIGTAIYNGIQAAITKALTNPLTFDIQAGGLFDQLFGGGDLTGLHKEDPARDKKSLALNWMDYIKQLTWSDFVPDVVWDTYVKALGWASYIQSLAWSSYIKMLNWASWVKSVRWADFIPHINWSDWITGGDNPASDATRFGVGGNAKGTANWRGGYSWVGERGPELAWLPKGSRIWSNEDSMAMAGGGITVNVSATINSDLDAEALAYQIANIIKRRGR